MATFAKLTDVREGSTRSGIRVWKFRHVLPGRETLPPEIIAPDSEFIAIRGPSGVSFGDITTRAYAETEARIARDASVPSLSM